MGIHLKDRDYSHVFRRLLWCKSIGLELNSEGSICEGGFNLIIS